ncbi:hypothetical protein HOY80DRAFT_1076052 [Tuber brumale]|nr:hypothetical protein HOY80DRAFT_1076052 [Tuber brumale]
MYMPFSTFIAIYFYGDPPNRTLLIRSSPPFDRAFGCGYNTASDRRSPSAEFSLHSEGPGIGVDKSNPDSMTHDDIAASNSSKASWGNSVNGKNKGIGPAATRMAKAAGDPKSDIMSVPGSSNQILGGLLTGSYSLINVNHRAMSILPSQHIMSLPPSHLLLLPLNGTFDRKFIPLPYWPDALSVGHKIDDKIPPTQNNSYPGSRHAEIWAQMLNSRVWIRNIRSSKGILVNGQWLSQENRDNESRELRAEDVLELGIDIVCKHDKDNYSLYSSCKS